MVHGQRKALRKTLADGTRYGIGVFFLTGERKEEKMVGFQKRNNHCLMPLEWRIIYQTFVQKFIVQAARILEISLQRQQLLSFVKYHDFLLFFHCLHYKFYIIVVYIYSSKERQSFV